jgi:hypothetical protein
MPNHTRSNPARVDSLFPSTFYTSPVSDLILRLDHVIAITDREFLERCRVPTNVPLVEVGSHRSADRAFGFGEVLRQRGWIKLRRVYGTGHATSGIRECCKYLRWVAAKGATVTFVLEGKTVAADPYGTGDSSPLNQWIGFLGALAFVIILFYTQMHQH